MNIEINFELFLKLQGLAQLVTEHFGDTDAPLGAWARACLEACKNPKEKP